MNILFNRFSYSKELVTAQLSGVT